MSDFQLELNRFVDNHRGRNLSASEIRRLTIEFVLDNTEADRGQVITTYDKMFGADSFPGMLTA